jgi:hypothetical protein
MPKKYSHVIVIGVDGAGHWFKEADTPCFDKIFADGAITYNALSSKPTISAECWGSMLIGVGPEVHKLTNSRVSTLPYNIFSKFPTVFKRIRKAYPDAELGSFCDWNPITKGIVEKFLDVSHATARDKELTPMICDYIKEKKPTFLFVQLDSVDYHGHVNGYGSKPHLDYIHVQDAMLGNIYAALAQAGIQEETLFMVISDHGGTNPGDGSGGVHGGWSDPEKLTTFAAVGRGVKSGAIEEMNVRDLAAIVLYALGIEPPAFDERGWTAQIPGGIFEDAAIPAYRDISHLTGAAPRISKAPHTSQLV